MAVRITDADESQLADIERIENLCFSVPWTRQQIISQLPDDNHVFIAAVDGDGRVLGYVNAAVVVDEGYISNVAVAPEQRRQGIGDALIGEMRARAERLGLAFVTLEVRASNAAARALYKKHGYTDVGTRKNYYEKPREDAILMTLFLK